MQKTHIHWIDDCKTLTMLLVIIGHCTYTRLMTPYGGICYFSEIPSYEYSDCSKMLEGIISFIFTFHMPLFMMLSGVCFRLTIDRETDMKELVKKKVRRLLLPFALTTLFLSVPLKYIGGYYSMSSDVLKDIILGQFLLMGNSHLWFVVSLFWIFVIYYSLHKIHVTEMQCFFPFLMCISIVSDKVIAFAGFDLALKHLFYFAIGFKYLHKLNTAKWGGGN